MTGITLWVEKYRPKDLDGYVFKNSDMENQIKSWLSRKDGNGIPFPNLLLSGNPGSGKTTLSSIICNIFNIEQSDILTINASRENNVETVREKIVGFCETYAVGDYKVVRLEECDHLSVNAQAILRTEIERFHESVRFILTCNYPNKIIPALHSRLQSYHFDKVDEEGFLLKLVEILEAEGVKYDPDNVGLVFNKAYPDLRKAINLLEQHTRDGELHPIVEASSSADYMLDIVGLFAEKKYTEARKLICSQIQNEEYETVYRYFYDNLEIFGDSDDKQTRAIMAIAQGLRDHAVVADPEINLSATICRLIEIMKE